MEWVIVALQLVIALGILNVWLLRFGKATDWRGGGARNMREEFAVYGLPPWFMYTVGFFKILFAGLLIAGVYWRWLTPWAAAGMGVLMLGAVAMHLKVKDPPKKALPSFTLLVLCGVVAVAGYAVV